MIKMEEIQYDINTTNYLNNDEKIEPRGGFLCGIACENGMVCGGVCGHGVGGACGFGCSK